MVKFGKLQNYTTIESLELDGVEYDFGDGMFVTIRRAGGANKAFQNKMAMILSERNTDIQGNPSDKKAELLALHKLFAETAVVGWRGMADSNGKEVKFSVQNCMDLFSQSSEFYEHVTIEATNLNNYREKTVAKSGNE